MGVYLRRPPGETVTVAVIAGDRIVRVEVTDLAWEGTPEGELVASSVRPGGSAVPGGFVAVTSGSPGGRCPGHHRLPA